ncbi:MAG: PD-(D/E)XK nuclease family protein [Anaerolineae bacterium]
MSRNIPDDFTFSQSSLQDYLDCPRRFELRYLRGQRWPAPEVDDLLTFEAHLARGERFHRLVQQHQAGVPEVLFRQRLTDPDLRDWFERYLQSGYAAVGEGQAEALLTVVVGAHTLTAKFDLVRLRADEALIVDWKTSRYPKRETVAQRAQTFVYPFVLASGGAALAPDGQPIPPDRIRMVYWYAATGQTHEFAYSAAQFERDRERLERLLDEIDRARSFPLTEERARCKFCVYRSLCDRGRAAGALSEYDPDEAEALDPFTLDLDQIAEVEF